MSKKDGFNGIYIEPTSEGEGDLSFGAGMEFTDTATPEYKAYMETLLAGVFCIFSTDIAQVEALGVYMREHEGFDWGESPPKTPTQDGDALEGDLLSDLKIYKTSKLIH